MTKWWWKADYFETCNCAHGCPCNLNSVPTDGTCRAIDTWQIREGAYGDTGLNGLTLALIVAWPNPIHIGNGKAVLFIDERADPAQREALTRIGRGEAGPGGPFEVFASTFLEPAQVMIGHVQVKREGKRVSLRFGDVAHAELAPIRSAMDGAEANARMILPDGFIWRDSQLVNTNQCEVHAAGLEFQHNDSSAFLSQVEYNL